MADVQVYPPSPEFVARAHVKGMEGYRELYQKAAERPEEFWGELAERELFWFQKWTHVFEWASAVREMVRRRQDQRFL